MARAEEGLRNEALKQALAQALAGDRSRLEDLLARHGTLPSAKPNLSLAAAFAVELLGSSGPVEALLQRLASVDAAPDTPLVFLPVAAAHGWAARIRAGQGSAAAWAALGELAADERTPVRLGTLDALVNLALREDLAQVLVAHAREWLEHPDREVQFGAAALVMEALAEPRVLSELEHCEDLLPYLSQALDAVAEAPRAAERSDARRRLLLSLPPTLANVAAGLRADERGLTWLSAECERARHPDVRRALSLATERLRTGGRAHGEVAERLKQKLEASAKPLRDAARVRPGTGRGRSSRRTR